MKAFIISILAFVILMTLAIFITLYGGSMIKPHQQSVHADHAMTVTLQTGSQEKVVDLLETFAKKYGLKSGFGFKGPGGKMFLFEMYSDDLRMITANPFEENVYEVSSYTDNADNPPLPVTADLMKELAKDFSALPGSKVTPKY